MKLDDFSDFPVGAFHCTNPPLMTNPRHRENLKNPLTSRVFRVVGASAAWETQKNYLQALANRLGSIGAIGKAPDRIFALLSMRKTQKGLPLKSDHACSGCDKIMTRCPIWIIFCLNHIRITRATWFSELGFWGRLSRPPDCREHKWRRKNVGILGKPGTT